MPMKKFLLLWILAVAAICVSQPARAHHGEANYDLTKVVTVQGIVTNFQFINPHVQIFLDVKNEKGEIEKWVGEARSPAMLVRIGGWDKNTIKPGDAITASGYRTKNGDYVLRLVKIKLPDGREMGDL